MLDRSDIRDLGDRRAFMLMPMADETLVLTLDTGESLSLKVDDAQAALDQCAKGEAPFDREWIRVGERRLIRCGSIVSVSIPGGESEPFVAFA